MSNVSEDLMLDIDTIEQQVREESLMPAELVVSEKKDITFNLSEDQGGGTGIKKVWELRWDRLDIDTTGPSGKKFLYQSSHTLPDPNDTRPVTNRERMTYVKQVKCFASLGLRGRRPEDFLGAKHWIKQRTESPGTRFEKVWWESVAPYREGQSYEEAVGGVSVPDVSNINPPAANNTKPEPEQSVEMSDDSPYTLLINTVNGKTHRAMLTAVRNTPELAGNEEIMNGVQSGELIDSLLEQGFLIEKEGKYFKAEPEG